MTESAPSSSIGARAPRDRSALITVAALVIAVISGGLVALGGPIVLLVGMGTVVAAWILIDYRIGILLTCAVFPLRGTILMPNAMFGIRGLSPAIALLGIALVSLALASRKVRGVGWTVLGLTVPWQLTVLYLAPITMAAVHGLGSIHLIPWSVLVTGGYPFETPLTYLFGAYASPLLVVLMGLMLGVLFRVEPDPRRYLSALLVAALTLVGLYIAEFAKTGHSFAFLASDAGREALAGTGSHPNDIVTLFLGAEVVCLFLIRATAGSLRLALIACTGLLTLISLLTFSRTGFVCELAILVAFLINVRRVKAILIALVLSPAALLVLPEAFIRRATEGMATMDMRVISASRATDVWPQLLPLVSDHPFLGGGLHSMLWSAPVRTGHIAVLIAHNAYLEAMLDMGLIGSLLVLAFFVWAWRQLHLAGKESADPFFRQLFFGAEVLIPLHFLQGLTGQYFTPAVQQAFLWMAIGAALGWRARSAPGMVGNLAPASKVASGAVSPKPPPAPRAAS